MRATEVAVWMPWLLGILSAAFLGLALRATRRRRLVDALPTSKTVGVFIGFVEVKGLAVTGAPLKSFLAELECVHYSWVVEEHWSRTVTETYTDNQGRTQIRTRHESGWSTVASGGELTAFYLQDDTGLLLVRPQGAELEPKTLFEETCGPGSPLYYGKGPAYAVANSDHRRRFVETGIPLHTPLYVTGQAREREDIVAPELAEDASAPMFLISTRTEEQISRGYGRAGIGWHLAGLVCAAGGLWVRDAMRQTPVEGDIPYMILCGLGYEAVAVLGWVGVVFNGLVDLRQRVRQAWSLVDVQLKRRHDLIPNLVAAVKGSQAHESTLQEELATLRSQMEATPPGEPGPDFRACSQTFLALAERYPDLRVAGNFTALQEELVRTEQRIALARGYFNDIATHYNTKLQVIPDGMIAELGGLRPQPLMEANAFERAPVEVSLTT